MGKNNSSSMKIEYSFPIYGKPEQKFVLLGEASNKDYFEFIESCGYQKKEISDPFYYNDEFPHVEIKKFYKDDSSIICLWDDDGAIHEFYCEDDQSALELTAKFLQMKRDMLQIQLIGKNLKEGG